MSQKHENSTDWRSALPEETRKKVEAGKYSEQRASEFARFWNHLEQEVFTHPVITKNPHTAWFRDEALSLEQLQAWVQQFSVFSKQFILPLCKKFINAHSRRELEGIIEVLVNELGVSYLPIEVNGKREIFGTVNGGKFSFGATHFFWMQKLASAVGLEESEIGTLEVATPETAQFVAVLNELYGSSDSEIAEAAFVAVEHWANRSRLWPDHIIGIKRHSERIGIAIPSNFFSYHGRLERAHERHSKENFSEYYMEHEINGERFVRTMHTMLDAVWNFFEGMCRAAKERK